jgi:biopolymer transport protein ExbD
MKRWLVYAVALVATWGYVEWRSAAGGDVLVQIEAGGGIRVEGEAVTLDALSSRLQSLLEDSGRAVRVSVDDAVAVPTLMAVVDAAKAGGATDVRLERLD